MKKQLIRDLRIGDEVETQALVVELNRANYSAPHRAGEFFLKLVLGDVSGRVKGVMWEPPAGDEVKQGDVVFVRGSVTDYHGPQVVVNDIRALDAAKVNRAFFQPVAEREPAEMMKELKVYIDEEVKDKYLKALLELFFADRELIGRFATAPAARTIHHSYVGGLVEHTLEVIALCRELVRQYPEKLRFELLIAGAFLHDIGKVEEYRQDSLSFDFTDRGKLVGHISIGKEMLDEKLRGLEGFPEDLRLELQHMMLTHHGMREWGSPEIPKTFHAFALFHADLVSARMNQFLSVMNKHQPESGEWTEWDRFLERSVFVPAGEGEE